MASSVQPVYPEFLQSDEEQDLGQDVVQDVGQDGVAFLAAGVFARFPTVLSHLYSAP